MNVYTHADNDKISFSKRSLLEDGADVFIRYNEVISIIRKVHLHNEQSFSEIVSVRNPYNIKDDFDITKNYKETLVYSCLGIENKKRVVKNIPSRFISRNHEETEKYRLFISKADGPLDR